MLTTQEQQHFSDMMDLLGPAVAEVVTNALNNSVLTKAIVELAQADRAMSFEGVLDTSLFSTSDTEPLFGAELVTRTSLPANYVRGEEQVWAQAYAAALSIHGDAEHRADEAVDCFRQRYSFLGQ